MPPKKKIDHQVNAVQAAEKHAPSIITLRGEDGGEFKIPETLLFRFSETLKHLLADSKDDVFLLSECDGETLQTVLQFIHMHKDEKPMPIITPIRSNQSLQHIMEENDAKYIEKIMVKGDSFILKMFNAANYMQVDDLKKRLACGLAIKLMKHTVDQLKEMYDLENDTFQEEELRSEFRSKIQLLRKMEDD